MAARVLGKYFLDVIGPLLAHSEAEPQFVDAERATLATITPESERPWDEFTATLARVAATLRGPTLVELGGWIIAESKAEFERWGFDTAEKILADWDAAFCSSVIDAPEHESVTTAKYEEGHAFIRAGAIWPAGLIEGQIRGVVAMFDAELRELDCHHITMDGRRFRLFELRWRASAVPRPIRRPSSGSYVTWTTKVA